MVKKFLAVALAMFFVAAAQAAQTTQTVIQYDFLTNVNQGLRSFDRDRTDQSSSTWTFQKFDPSLGTLNSIQINTSGFLNQAWIALLTGPTQPIIVYDITQVLYLVDGLSINANNARTQRSFQSPVTYAGGDYSLGYWHPMSTWNVATNTTLSGAALQAYQLDGRTTANFTIRAYQQNSWGQPSPPDLDLQGICIRSAGCGAEPQGFGSSGLQIDVTYIYTPPPAAQVINFPAIGNIPYGSPFTLTATASSGLLVSFTSSTPTVCTVSGTSVNLQRVGTCTIAANQAGDVNWLAAPTVTRSFTVTTAQQTITFGPLSSASLSAPSVALTATATSGLVVGFISQTLPVCTVAGTTVTLLAPGTCTIGANQSGDTNYAAAPTVTQSFAVTAGTGGAGDVPTLPEWGAILLGLTLLMQGWRRMAR
jgi:hypothetical protein